MRPMLATDAPEQLRYPLFVSPKIDGIRVLIKDNVAVSRNLKPLPNHFTRNWLSFSQYEGFDGEIVVGSFSAMNTMQVTTSGIMTREGRPDFTYWVFDYWNDRLTPYRTRLERLREQFKDSMRYGPKVRLLQQTLIHTEEELHTYEQQALSFGFEGVMVRHPDSPYKYGRSTAKEGYLLKIKRFRDSEAVVIDVQELMHNANEATTDNLGYTQRSSHISNLVGRGTLGSLIVEDVSTGIRFSIGTGFDAKTRARLWKQKEDILGKLVKYKFFESGVKVAPRFPVFISFRDEGDMSE